MRFLSAILLSLILIATAEAQSATGNLLVKDDQTVAFLGDSITALGWDAPGGYVRLTVAGLKTLGVNVTPIPAGVSGNTSRDMLARLTHDVLSRKPDWLTLSCGVNDVWHGAAGVPLDEYEKNITSIVDQAQAAGIKVLLMTSTVIGEDDNDNNKRLVAYNEFLQHLAEQRHLPLAEENAAFQNALKENPGISPYLTWDGVHPNTDGAQVVARALLVAFGATAAQVAQAQAAWMEVPDLSDASFSFEFNGDQPLTLKQYNTLKAIAFSQKRTVRAMCAAIYLDALAAAIQAHHQDAAPDPAKIHDDTRQAFLAKIADLIK
jgi:lysophospholipase L1-like esterase